MQSIASARSLLFAPGNEERKLRGALEAGADVVVADLEEMDPSAATVFRQLRTLRPLMPLLLFSDAKVEDAEHRLVSESVADVSLSKSLGPDQLASEILRRCGNPTV
jgi:hypothetical protein